MKVSYSHPACDVGFDESADAVFTVWKGKYAEGETMHHILDSVISLMREKHTGVVIADARLMKPISRDDQEWIVNDWYPRAVAAGFRTELLVISPYSHHEQSIRSIVSHYDDEMVGTFYFHSLDDVRAWLLSHDHHADPHG